VRRPRCADAGRLHDAAAPESSRLRTAAARRRGRTDFERTRLNLEVHASTESLRTAAAEILRRALEAVEPGALVRRALERDGDRLQARAWGVDLREIQRVWLVGAGKAAAPMAAAVLERLGERIEGGVVTVPHGSGAELPGIDVWEAAHPLPDAHGAAAVSETLRLLRGAGPGDLVICVLSGGASALWTAPPRDVALGEVVSVVDGLMRAGATIHELNTVRRQLGGLGGGRLALAAHPARVLALAISDVVGSPLEDIGSGPTVGDPSGPADALEVLARRGILPPANVVRHLQRGVMGERPANPTPGDPRLDRADTVVIADYRDALVGAARTAERLGFRVRVSRRPLAGEARVAAVRIVHAVDGRPPAEEPEALLWGGETVVHVRGDGRGGRNQELALAAALELEGRDGIVLATLGTDGVDGPTDAAGGVVDGLSAERCRSAGIDPVAALERNDAYRALRAAGDLIVTGPTGTNVNDLVLVLRAPGRRDGHRAVR
jgi:glycerate 2-kinase